jgi:hypothetical protein
MPTPDHTLFSFTQSADICWFVVVRSVSHVAPMDHLVFFFTLRITQGRTRPKLSNPLHTSFVAMFTGENMICRFLLRASFDRLRTS